MKKIIITILTLTVILSSTACNKPEISENNSSQNQSTKNTKDAEKVAKKFMDKICELDIEGAKEYILNPEDIPQKIKDITSLKDFAEQKLNQLPQELQQYEKDFAELFSTATSDILNILSYKITDSEVEDNKVFVDVELITPSEKAFENVGEKISTKAKEQIKLIAEEAFYEGQLTESSTDEETLNIVMSELFTYLNTYIKDFIKNAKTEPTEIELVLEKQNGQWKIILADIED